MSNIQIIEKDGKPEWAVIPFKDYVKIKDSLEDIDDIRTIERHMKDLENGKDDMVPEHVVMAILDGISPIRAWREFKNIKMKDLAEKVGVSSAFLSQIETGKRNPTIDTLKKIAENMGVDLELLI